MLRALLCLLILCAGCLMSAASGEVASPNGEVAAPDAVVTLAQAQQADAPALAMTDGGLIVAWIGSDERGVHQDARRFTSAGLGEIVTLPLPPAHPYEQTLLPGDHHVHLLWLDAGQDDQTQLFAALLSPELAVERGPVSVSEGLALDYSAVPDSFGGLWAAWSGGLAAEMSLYARRIDDAGRPLVDTMTIAANVDHPALVRTNAGEVWLFWLANGQVMRQRLDPAGEGGARALTGAVSLAPGDHLINVSAGLDRSNAYFFWNIMRAGGANETWFTAGALAANSWRQPQRLRIATGAETSAYFALRWTTPSPVQAETLTAITETDAGLSVVQLSDGVIVGYKTVAPGERLIGLPSLASDANETLYLAWAAPGDDSASLQLIAVQP
jgi:hypothetical protein